MIVRRFCTSWPNLFAKQSPLGTALQKYFCQYLIAQRSLSPQTVSAYRDTFKLLIHFLGNREWKDIVGAAANGTAKTPGPPGRISKLGKPSWRPLCSAAD